MNALLAIAVIGVTELLKRLKAKDWQGAGTIVLAGLVGVGAGLLGVEGLNVTTGLVASLAAVGVHTTVKLVK